MPTPISRGGVGIQGMRERVRQLGGELEIESGTVGTRVTAKLVVDVEHGRPTAAMNLAS
jgi:signal transduction histidine kinase